METSYNLKLNNNYTNMKNKFSSIFSYIFKRKKMKNAENSAKRDNMIYNNSKKSKNHKNQIEFVEKIEKTDSNEKFLKSERGVLPPFLIKIIVGVVIFLVVAITLFVLFYTMVSNASLEFNIDTMAEAIKEFFVMIFYSIAKWILTVVDIIFSYVKSLCGLNMDFSSLNGIFSAQSDIIFNLFITAEKRATEIFKNLVALSIVMIIVFTIIALIKSQLEAMRKAKPTSVMDTIKKTIRAFVLLLITPLMAIVGIVFSDLLLQTLFRATNTTESSTLGTQIFATAAVSSNAYRNYALNKGRIPITCDFTRQKEILDWYEHNPPNDTFEEYLVGSKNLIYVTFMSFVNNDFIKFNDINDILSPSNAENREKAYYGIYDIKVNGNKYERIEAYAEEYYVMADVIDYAVNTGNSLYIKTIEDVLDSICEIEDETVRNRIFNLMVQKYNLTFYSSIGAIEDKSPMTEDGKEFISCDKYKAKGWNFCYYDSYYMSPNDNGTPENPMQIPYVHVKGAHDEIDGAKYIIVHQSSVTANGIDYKYFEPMVNGYIDRYDISFDSEYIEDGQIISAKGDFKDGIYPTAIKETSVEDKTQITFYRENIETVAVGAINEIFKANLNDDGDSSWFTNFVKMIQLFFQPDSIIGEVTYDASAVQKSYSTKGVATVNNLVTGRIKLGYFLKFKPSSADRFANGRTISFKELFDPQKFNVILIFVAPLLLCRVGMIALFGLIQRAYELFLIILTYPAACATIPYEEKAYSSWWNEYFQRLFATYGIILGINFVLALFPVINTIEYFTPGEIATNKILYKVTHLFFGFLTISQITKLLNTMVIILFELVAFTLLDAENGIPHMIDQMLGTNGLQGGFVEMMKKLVQRVVKTVKFAVKVVGTVVKVAVSGTSTALTAILKPQNLKKKNEKLKAFGLKLLPGSSFLNSMQRKGAGKATKKAMKQFGNKSASFQANPPGEEPKKPDKKDFMIDDPEKEGEKKLDEEAFQKAMDSYEKDKEKWDQDQKDRIDPLRQIIIAQEKELEALGEKVGDKEADNKAYKKEEKDKDKGKEKSKGDSDQDSGGEGKTKSQKKMNQDQNDSDDDSDSETPKENEDSTSPENNSENNSSDSQGDDSQDSGDQGENENNDGQDSESDNNSEDGKGDDNQGGSESTPPTGGGGSSGGSKPKRKPFNPDDYGNEGLEDEMKDTQKRYRDEARRQDALELQLEQQRKNGDTDGAKKTEALIKQSQQRQKELDDQYFEIYKAQQDRIAEEQRIMKSGTAEERQQLQEKNRIRAANDRQRFADKEARGETTSARIKTFVAGAASSVGNNIKNKVVGTASNIWNRHLDKRNAKWASAYANVNGGIFSKIGGKVYRSYIEQRLGGAGKMQEYDNVTKQLEQLNKRYPNPEKFDKNSQEYKDYIKEKTSLENRKQKLEEGFNTLSQYRTNRTQNKVNSAQKFVNKATGDINDYADYEDTSTLYRKLRAIRHPLKTLKAKTANYLAETDGAIVGQDLVAMQQRRDALVTELNQLKTPVNAQQMARKQAIERELSHIEPMIQGYGDLSKTFNRLRETKLLNRARHINEDNIIYE